MAATMKATLSAYVARQPSRRKSLGPTDEPVVWPRKVKACVRERVRGEGQLERWRE